ncbi:SH3 domain-containing protein [Robbsia andropogonis]|uniref:SH3 domain-containing protein n=1 Tax=Robbsia andropogonis TaxID=28092 RepID=UPI002A69F1B2|nr:SH3 domain-containing protein [Robbsia andropogonis]
MTKRTDISVPPSLDAKQAPRRVLARFGGIALLACVTPFAHAQSAPAYTNAPAIVRAGPSQEYPAVAQLQGGTPMTVLGCVAGYSWCDVSLPGLRGWVYGGNINYAYQGTPVPLLTYGPRIGLPIIGFSFGTYWGEHYRAQPWYGERGRWEHIGPPPPPPGWHGGPPPGPRPEWHGGPAPRPEWHGGPPQPQRDGFHGGPGQGPRSDPRGGPPQGGHPPERPHGDGDGDDHRGPPGPPHG